MTPSNTHPGTAARGLRRTFLLQAVSGLLTARARRRSADRVRARPRLEGLEDRCLLSSHHRVPRPDRPVPTLGDHSGSRRQPLVHRATARQDRDDQPDDPRHHRVPHPHRQFRSCMGSRRAPTATSGSPSCMPSQIGMINPTTHAITEFPRPPPAAEPYGITAGPDGNLWFTELRRRPDRDDQPDDPRHHRVRHPHRQCRSPGDHGGPRRQPLVHRDAAATRSG